MDESQRYLVKIRMINRSDLRTLFGMEFCNKWGFFTDRCMSRIIHSFAHCIDYPKWDYQVRVQDQNVQSMAVSHDGYYLYAGSHYGLITMWDLMKRETMKHWTGHHGSVLCLAYHRRALVSGSDDRTVRIWNPYSHRRRHVLKGHSDTVRTVDINRRGTEIASGSDDNTVRLWSVEDGTALKILSGGHSGRVSSVHFNLGVLLSGSADASIAVWNSFSGALSRKITDDIGGVIVHSCLNCDGSLLACMMGENGFSVFNLRTLEKVVHFSNVAFFGCFHPRIPHSLVVSGGTIKLYDLSIMGRIRISNVRAHGEGPLQFTADGSRLLVTKESGFVQMLDPTYP